MTASPPYSGVRQIQQTKANNETLENAGIDSSFVLFGEDWSINTDQASAEQLRQALGGIVTH